MELDPLLLSRLQFAFVIAFHIVFPAFTVGLASYIAVLEGMYLWRRDERFLRASKFWLRIFAVSFGMGVVSGIVMPFQLGTNWSEFSAKTANVVGPLLAYERLTAFFLEAGFLGVLLFGRERVPPWAHFMAAVLVAAGTLFSSFWILAFNSWMQTPVGHIVDAGRFSTHARTLMMTSVAPVWDGNETWLVMGGAGLFAAFPVAFAILMPALYFPILLLLLGLIFRGVAFEFRMKATHRRSLWSAAFFFGSLTAAFAQGLILGNYIHGFAVGDGRYVGTSWDWLKPFAVVTGLGVIAGYALLGATWLVLKTEGELQVWSRRMALRSLWATGLFMAAVSVYSPFVHERVFERWFAGWHWLWLAPLPIATLTLFWLTHRALRRGRSEVGPFLAALGIFALCYLGLGVSLFPYVVPHVVTLHEAAAVPQAQAFLLIGTLLLLPVILGYTAWSYWVFRGKVTQALGYH